MGSMGLRPLSYPQTDVFTSGRHVFGRNKRCTHQIPDDCWIKYCRKHYQRQKYRCPSDWFETQLLLIDGQIDKMEACPCGTRPEDTAFSFSLMTGALFKPVGGGG